MKQFKYGFQQASWEIHNGLRPIYVFELNQFWIGYNCAILLRFFWFFEKENKQ